MYGLRKKGGRITFNSINGGKMKNKFLKTLVLIFSITFVGNILVISENINVEASGESGLIAYWSFDDSSNPGYDYSGNAHHGTNHGATWVSDGIIQGALKFNGNDYVSIEDDGTLDLETWTISTWIKMEKYTPYSTIICNGEDPLSDRHSYWLLIYLYDGNDDYSILGSYEEVYHDDPGRYVRIDNVENIPNQWHHIAFTHDLDHYSKIYFDGELIGQKYLPYTPSSPNSDIYIGASYNEKVTYFFNGLIDEVKIYDGALTKSQIRNLYNYSVNINQLVAYWSFDDKSNVGYDDSENEHQGINYGSSWNSNGIVNGALEFDGINDYMTVSDYSDFEFDQNDDFTINFWRKDFDNGGTYYIGCSIDHNAGQYSGWGIHSSTYPYTDSNKGAGVGIYITESSNQVTTLTDTFDDDWHMITMTKNGNQVNLFIDGILKDSDTINTPLYVDHGFIIGANINDGYKDPEWFFKGLLDEIKIYNYALSQSEIISNYQEKDRTIILQDNWDNNIDLKKWTYVDEPTGGHKTSIAKGELFINAYDDWTGMCGIISNEKFSLNTKVTFDFKISKIRVYNDYQSIVTFLSEGTVDDEGHLFGQSTLFRIAGGNDDNRDLLVYYGNGKYDPRFQLFNIGSYIPNKKYTCEILFTTTGTKITINEFSLTLSESYSQYYIHFGGHVEDSYFDNLVIRGNISENVEPVYIEKKPDLYLNSDDISFSNPSPRLNEQITIFSTIHNKGENKGIGKIYFYDDIGLLIDSRDIIVESGEKVVVATKWTVEKIGVNNITVNIADVSPVEDVKENNIVTSSLIIDESKWLLVITTGISNIAPIEENTSRTIPITLYCYNNAVNNVYVKILDDAGLHIYPLSPDLNMNPGDKIDYLIHIESPGLSENLTYEGRTIILQAVGDNGVFSNTESIDIISHESVETPGFTFIAVTTASILGALVAFFRRVN